MVQWVWTIGPAAIQTARRVAGRQCICQSGSRTTVVAETADGWSGCMPSDESKNIILHGPPGTGKTYETIKMAVELCGVSVPENDRAALQKEYQRLVDARRIEFVTFHQSLSYEDFVEGLRPETESGGADGSTSGGFSLKPVPGVFRGFVENAVSGGTAALDDETELGTKSRFALGPNRKVFKMSLGQKNNRKDDKIYDDAIKFNHVRLNVIDIDISDPEYSDNDKILELLKNYEANHERIADKADKVWTLERFKNQARLGDIIIIAWGTKEFRAIGEITGEYEYRERTEPGYRHYRNVKWHWVKSSGVGVDKIKKKKIFNGRAFYEMKKEEWHFGAIEDLVNSDKREGVNSNSTSDVEEKGNNNSYVLIIDEINRANISKVFGELISLIEEDKRLGEQNELTVKLPYSRTRFGVPPNLYIVGTMNTADRSIALLDTALRRRFTFREMMPDPSLLDPLVSACGVDLPILLATLNKRIEYLHDREHQIGHAYFMQCTTSDKLDKVMRQKVIPLLAEYFFEDWGKVAVVLGDGDPEGKGKTGGFLRSVVLKRPEGGDDDDESPRIRWEVRSEDEGFYYANLVGQS